MKVAIQLHCVHVTVHICLSVHMCINVGTYVLQYVGANVYNCRDPCVISCRCICVYMWEQVVYHVGAHVYK